LITTLFFIYIRFNQETKRMSAAAVEVDLTIYATGNGMKLDDLKRVLGEGIITQDLKIVEIQDMPLRVAEDKIRRCFDITQTDVCCEETSFGVDEVAAYVKQINQVCKKYGGSLDKVWDAMAPKLEFKDYTSIVAFKNKDHEAFFECTMKCRTCSRKTEGLIDPFTIPVEYTIKAHVNGTTTILEENVAVDNPDQLSIAEQSSKRHLLHPRYVSLRAYHAWRLRMARGF